MFIITCGVHVLPIESKKTIRTPSSFAILWMELFRPVPERLFVIDCRSSGWRRESVGYYRRWTRSCETTAPLWRPRRRTRMGGTLVVDGRWRCTGSTTNSRPRRRQPPPLCGKIGRGWMGACHRGDDTTPVDCNQHEGYSRRDIVLTLELETKGIITEITSCTSRMYWTTCHTDHNDKKNHEGRMEYKKKKYHPMQQAVATGPPPSAPVVLVSDGSSSSSSSSMVWMVVIILLVIIVMVYLYMRHRERRKREEEERKHGAEHFKWYEPRKP